MPGSKLKSALAHVFLAAGLGLCPVARAAYTVTFLEVAGPTVTATGVGSLNLAALVSSGSGPITTKGAVASVGIATGPCSPDANELFSGAISGPVIPVTGAAVGSSASGDCLAFIRGGGPDGLWVPLTPASYVSGAPLNSSSAFSGQTFASMGLTPGTYVWTWGAGPTADSYTLQVGPLAPPVPAPTLQHWALGLLSAALALTGAWSSRRRMN